MLKLMKYEYRKNMGIFVSLASALLVAEVYFLVSIFFESESHLLAASLIFLFGGLAGVLALMISGAVSYSREIGSKYSYMTFMTPNSPHKIVGAKYLVLLSITVVATIAYVGFVMFDLYFIFSKYEDIKIFKDMVVRLAKTFGWDADKYLLMFVSIMITIWIGFFFTVSCAYLAITLSATLLENKKGKGILSVVFFFAIDIAFSRISRIIPNLGMQDDSLRAALLNNLPTIIFQILAIFGSYMWVAYMLKKKISL